MALADGCGEGTFESDVVASDTVNGLVRNDGLAIFERGGDVYGFPLDWNVRRRVDVLD